MWSCGKEDRTTNIVMLFMGVTGEAKRRLRNQKRMRGLAEVN
jgi:hypothetical protein